jgi:N6-L-threonylcarbamoyladenine synthase
VLLVSGGHTQVLEVDSKLRARKHADTADDAAGECFDKSAKLMGLDYPGGPAIEKIALECTSEKIPFAREILAKLPRPRSTEGFSFSGLKTAVRVMLANDPSLNATPEFCWALQECIAETLVRGLDASFKRAALGARAPKSLVFCGGVSANRRLREAVGAWAAKKNLALKVPPIKYCTDNAAMIAAAAWVQAPELHLSSVASRLPLELGAEPST